MVSRWITSFANVFLVVYCLDAGLSIVEEIFRAITESGALMPLRNVIASFALYLAVLCIPILWLTPRLPLGAFAALCVTAIWLNTGAAPLPLFFDSQDDFNVVAGGLQGVVALAALLACRRRNGGMAWLLQAADMEKPLFSLRHSLIFSLSCVLLTPAVLFYGFLSVLCFMHVGTQGFVSFDWGGVTLADRRYLNGEQEVRLVGMMHIGEDAAYGELVRSFSTESAIVLEEGVSDERAMLEETLDYGRAADFLGLVPQGDLRTYLAAPDEELPEWPVLRNADVDMSDFDPLTVEWLELVARVWSDPEPLQPLQALTARARANPEQLGVVQRDILTLRNEKLLQELDVAIGEYPTVIVPWGALHLSFIEAAIRERGFEETRRDRHRLVSWMTILDAFF
jgi:hypothetical protein